jgi:hypothetical protein
MTGYSISPALPAGLSINSSTGAISGTPTVTSANTSYTVTATYAGGSTNTIINICVKSDIKPLCIKAYLEGLWNGSTMNMNQCKDENNSEVFPSAVDTAIVELHSSSSYANIVYRISGVYIDQDGNFYSNNLPQMQIPSSYNGSYFITVKTRNHLVTTSASAISFAGDTIRYNFTSAANMAYGNNMKELTSGIFGFYAGDVNQDGVIDSVDGNIVTSSSNNFEMGYRPEDLNGDGSTNSDDVSIVDGNDASTISASHP